MASWRLQTPFVSLHLHQETGGLNQAPGVIHVFRGAVSWLQTVKNARAAARRQS